MSESGAAHCAICLNHCPLDADRFAIFPCGGRRSCGRHGFCTGCISRLFLESRPKCPSCRTTLHRRDAHPVFIEFIDPQTFLETSVVDGLNQMDAETPHISVKKASRKLAKILEGSKANEGNMSLLFQAIEDFKERITPVFSKVETQKQEIDSLRDDLRRARRDKDHVQNKLRKSELWQPEVTRLKAALVEAEQNTEDVLRVAEAVKDELAAQHVSTTQWKKKAAELEQENKHYKDLVDRNVNAARLQKEKYRKISKELAVLKAEKLAKEDRDRISATSNEYDGDFSSHEQSRTSRMSTKISRRTSTHHHDENKAELDLEGIPPANFPSEWQLEGSSILRKRNLNGDIVSGHRRVTNPFPINLDRKGHPTRAVQLGPKSIMHVSR